MFAIFKTLGLVGGITSQKPLLFLPAFSKLEALLVLSFNRS